MKMIEKIPFQKQQPGIKIKNVKSVNGDTVIKSKSGRVTVDDALALNGNVFVEISNHDIHRTISGDVVVAEKPKEKSRRLEAIMNSCKWASDDDYIKLYGAFLRNEPVEFMGLSLTPYEFECIFVYWDGYAVFNATMQKRMYYTSRQEQRTINEVRAEWGYPLLQGGDSIPELLKSQHELMVEIHNEQIELAQEMPLPSLYEDMKIDPTYTDPTKYWNLIEKLKAEKKSQGETDA
jgi:hypothetical protein